MQNVNDFNSGWFEILNYDLNEKVYCYFCKRIQK